MLTTIPDLLDKDTLAEIRRLLADAEFVDGRFSAGRDAQRVKHNEELKTGAAQTEQLNRMVLGALYEHPTFQAALPVSWIRAAGPELLRKSRR